MVEGDGLPTVHLSSSSEELKVNQCHTGLHCDWLVPVLHGVAGSKETFSSLDMVDFGGSSEKSGHVNIFTTTLISFIF